MCTTVHNYDSCGVGLDPTEKSSEESVTPAGTRLLIAPSLNAVLQGTLVPNENIDDIEHAIWLPQNQEIFLRASLQFLENKLHNRIYHATPTPSGTVVLSEGFIFTPVYPPDNLQESSSVWEECVTKVHNLSDEDGSYSWGQEKGDVNRVASVMYSCVSIPNEHDTKVTQDADSCSYGCYDSQRDVGIQTSSELLITTSEKSPALSDEEPQPIHTFSEYVQYCQTYIRPPSQLFSFGESSSHMTDNKTNDAMPEISIPTGDSFQSTDNDMEEVPNSARTYSSHYRSSITALETSGWESPGQDTCALYASAGIHGLSAHSSKVTESNTTLSSVKSIVSNKTDHSASTKSVYYYARISASFFSFLNRATKKNKHGNNDEPSSVVPNVSSATTSNVSTLNQKCDRSTNSLEGDGECKLSSAKLNVLRRFMNFFGSAKASHEYEKVNDPSAAIIDVTSGLFKDDQVFDSEPKQDSTDNNQKKMKCSSFSVPGNQLNTDLPGWAASVVSSEITVERKESKHFIKPSRKVQTKPKSTRHTPRVNFKDSDYYSSRTTVQDLALQQHILESYSPDVQKGSPSPVSSSVTGSKTSYSKTVCKDILKLRFEGDTMPMKATDTISADGRFEGDSMMANSVDISSNGGKIEGGSTLVATTDTTSTEGNECCICYKPPPCYRNGVLPYNVEDWQRNRCNQTVLCARNEYICYARVPENQRLKESYHLQRNSQTEQPKRKDSIGSFLKSRFSKGQSTGSGSSSVFQKPTPQHQGKLILKPKPPIRNNNNQCRRKSQEYEILDSGSQSTQVTSYVNKPKLIKEKQNTPLIRKQNTYLIEKPQVYPDRITRLMPENNHNNIWTSHPSNLNKYQESTGGLSSFTATTNVMSQQLTGSTDETTDTSFSGLPNIAEEYSSMSTSPEPILKNLSGIQGLHKYKYHPKESVSMNTASTSSSDFDAPTSCVNNTVSNSSRSSYWLPPKRLARDSRDFPKLNPSKSSKIKPSFSKEVIKLFQRTPKAFKK